MELIDEIVSAQQENEESLLKLIKRFEPLIKKYAQKLNSSDMENELFVFFTRLILNIKTENFDNDYQVLKYIKNSIYHHYIALLKRQSKENKVAALYMLETRCCGNEAADFCDSVEFWFTVNHLDPFYKRLFYYYYVYGYSIIEISKEMKISEYQLYRHLKELQQLLKESDLT